MKKYKNTEEGKLSGELMGMLDDIPVSITIEEVPEDADGNWTF